jgi:uncharacterized protein VirK/YbjX
MLNLHPYFSSFDELFACTDDGSGGPWHTLRRRVKLRFRSWFHADAIRSTIAVFRDEQLQGLPCSEPGLLLKPLRSYLRRGLSPLQRAQAMHSHFSWLTERLPKSAIESLYQDRGLILSEGLPGAAPGASRLRIVLTRAGGWGREGELALHLEHEETRLMTLAFSVVERHLVFGGNSSSHVLLVGVIQGRRGADSVVHAVSHDAERLRPHVLLVTALQGLAHGLGVDSLYGISASAHVYAGYRSRARRVGIDYDALWSEVGGTKAGSHYWALPAQPRLRHESEVPSKKRSQHRRRNALREALFAQCEAGTRSVGSTLRSP